jgi:phasin family protein
MLQRSKAGSVAGLRPGLKRPTPLAGPLDQTPVTRSRTMATIPETKTAEVKKLVNEAAQNGAAQTRKLVDESAVQARVAMETSMEQANKAAEGFMKAAEQAAEFGRGNAEAVAKATQAYVAGVQDLSRLTMALLQGLTDQAVEGAKALSTVRSLKEATEIQTNLTRAALQRTLSESAKLQETALKVAEQSFAPISARMTLAVEKMARPIAA